MGAEVHPNCLNRRIWLNRVSHSVVAKAAGRQSHPFPVHISSKVLGAIPCQKAAALTFSGVQRSAIQIYRSDKASRDTGSDKSMLKKGLLFPAA